jgi:predicted DNA-binding transcriptional regulator AlpA
MVRPTPNRRPPDSREEPTRLLLTAQRSADQCGTSVRTWRTWCASGRVPAPIRIGRSLFWRRKELEAWVAAGCPGRTEWMWARE